MLFALRSLRKAPVFFLLAVTTLGLGIAANTAIFSLFYQVLLRSLPVHEPERLVVLHYDKPTLFGSSSNDTNETVFSYPFYLSMRDNRALDGLAARSSSPLQMMIDGAAERTRAELVSGNFFTVLGLTPRLGRLFTPADDSVRGGNPVAVLTYDFWMRRFAASTAVLNRTILLNGQPFTIVGVAPEGFRGILAGVDRDLFVPVSMMAALTPGWKGFDEPGTQWLTLIGRLAPGISRESARAQLQPLFSSAIRVDMDRANATKEERARFEHKRLELHSAANGLNSLERSWRQPLYVLLAMVLLLLLIGCANVANLLMARAVNRSREIGIRLALGAGRARVVRLLFTESILLALIGTLLGVALSLVLTRGIIRMMPASAIGGWLSGELNIPILLFSALLMIAATTLFGLAPALQATRAELSGLGARSHTSGGAIHSQARKALLAGQIALSLMLLCTAGLFGRSLANLMRFDPGFRPDHLLTFSVDAGLGGYDNQRGMNFYRDVTRRVGELPGVQSVSMAFAGPVAGSRSISNVSVERYTPRSEEEMLSENNAVGPDYFRTLGIPLIEGREFDVRDKDGAPKVAIVNQKFVKRFIGNHSAVGWKMERGSGGPLDITIVGVAGDSVTQNLREPAMPMFYIPFEQAIGPSNARAADGTRILRGSFFVRSRTGLDALQPAIRGIVSQLDPALAVYAMHPIQMNLDDSIYTDRLVAALATAFGFLALTLTAVGLYGVIGYLVSRRTAEIGIRMVLGAEPRTIVSMIAGEVGLLIVLGGAVGLIGAIAAGRAIQSQLFGMGGIDPLVLAVASLVLSSVALLAACVPAIRASRVQPLTALRHE